MAIHKTLRLITTKYPNEPAHIFTDCLNCIYVLNTQIKYPTKHHNHADKSILTSMVEMLKSRTQLTTIYKVKAHTNITGNKHADQLAKNGTKKNTDSPTKHTNLHIPHHSTTKKTNSLDLTNDPTKALSDAYKLTSPNTTAKLT
jgi:ribonuclease HI